MKTRWSKLKNGGFLLSSSKLVINMAMIFFKYLLYSQKIQFYFGLQQYFILFTAFWMKYYEYYITWINTISKIWKCLCVSSFPSHIYIENHSPWLLAFSPSTASWNKACLSCGPLYKYFRWTWLTHIRL